MAEQERFSNLLNLHNCPLFNLQENEGKFFALSWKITHKKEREILLLFLLLVRWCEERDKKFLFFKKKKKKISTSYVDLFFVCWPCEHMRCLSFRAFFFSSMEKSFRCHIVCFIHSGSHSLIDVVPLIRKFSHDAEESIDYSLLFYHFSLSASLLR